MGVERERIERDIPHASAREHVDMPHQLEVNGVHRSLRNGILEHDIIFPDAFSLDFLIAQESNECVPFGHRS